MSKGARPEFARNTLDADFLEKGPHARSAPFGAVDPRGALPALEGGLECFLEACPRGLGVRLRSVRLGLGLGLAPGLGWVVTRVSNLLNEIVGALDESLLADLGGSTFASQFS